MNNDREQLAEAIQAAVAIPDAPATALARHLADALLPVVEDIAKKRAAEELRAAAEGLTDRVRTWVLNDIRDRADALESDA